MGKWVFVGVVQMVQWASGYVWNLDVCIGGDRGKARDSLLS